MFKRGEAKPTIPPSVGAELLLFLKRRDQHHAEQVRSMDGPVFVIAPDRRTIETVRGTAWLSFQVKPIPEVKSPQHPVAIGGAITNHSLDSMSFDLRHLQITYADMPMGLAPGDRWHPHPPPNRPLRLAPGESREYFFGASGY